MSLLRRSCREMQLNQHLREEVGNSFGSMDDQEEDRKPSKTLSVLQRLDRLDQLMQILEERHGLSARHPNDLVMRKAEPQDECKSISSALEEVQHKGTLVERVAMLENRLLQLNLEIDAANTSKLSSSGALSTEKIGNNKLESNAAVGEENRKDAAAISQEKKAPSPPKPMGTRGGRRSLQRRREWFGCFQC